eukprot:COSAG01_NODE_4078_length_5377_cov_48.766578_1_plen_107_part_10
MCDEPSTEEQRFLAWLDNSASLASLARIETALAKRRTKLRQQHQLAQQLPKLPKPQPLTDVQQPEPEPEAEPEPQPASEPGKAARGTLADALWCAYRAAPRPKPCAK